MRLNNIFKNSKINACTIYILVLVIISCFLIKWATEIGMDTDVVLRIEGGRSSIEYFKSLGKDTTYKDAKVLITQEKVPHHNIYYGTGIETAALLVADVLGYETYSSINQIRKIIIVILSCLGFFVLSFFVKTELESWRWGIITLLLIFISPTFIGYSFWQTKDAPVVTGFALSLSCLYLLFKYYPVLNKKYLVGLLLGVFLITIIRVQGILIIFYLGTMGIVHMALCRDKYKSVKDFFRFYIIS